MQKIYFYKLTVDSGGAPCVENGLLSLAICKPMIRKTAQEGNLIFGFAAKSLHPDNRLIYVAKVTEKLCDGKYYKTPKYLKRRDCIYRPRGARFIWKKGAAYHGPKDLVHDLGRSPSYERANVLVSNNFRYFGEAGTNTYKSKFPRIARAVESLGRGSRTQHNEMLKQELRDMADWLWQKYRRKVNGKSTSSPTGKTCLRGGPCGRV